MRSPSGALVEQPLVGKRSAQSAVFDFFYVHQAHRDLRLGVGPKGRSLWPTQEERARTEAERAQAAVERAHVEAERAHVEAERAQTQTERADRAEAELARLREQLAALRR